MLWSNWSGVVHAQPAAQIAVRDEEHLATLIRDPAIAGPIRPLGAGHSFTELCATDGGTLLRLDGLNGVARDPEQPNVARIGAGGVLGEVTAALHAQNHALANMGDIDNQRIGGAVATATHGTGPTFGCYPSMLQGLRMLDGRGQPVELDRDRDPDAFRAMAVGLGTGGIVTELRVRCVAPYRLERTRFVVARDEIFEDFAGLMTSARNVELMYVPFSGHALGLRSVETEAAPTVRPPDEDQQALRLLRLLAQWCGPLPALRRFVLSRALGRSAREHFVEDWHRAFPTDRDGHRFNETEYHLPAEAAPQALQTLITRLEKELPGVYFPIEVRSVAADDLYLSPFSGRESVSIAVHHASDKPMGPVLALAESVFRAHAGRPHWGKMHTLRAAELRTLYPHWDAAIEARHQYDPDNRFVSPYLRALLGL